MDLLNYIPYLTLDDGLLLLIGIVAISGLMLSLDYLLDLRPQAAAKVCRKHHWTFINGVGYKCIDCGRLATELTEGDK